MARDAQRTKIVCLTGPESSGKTTLAARLAAYCGAPLVHEVAREYLRPGVAYGPGDLRAIAEAQREREQAALAAAPEVLVLDTDVLVIAVWWDVRFGARPAWLRALLEQRSPRHYLLMYPDLPWQPDPLRESARGRFALFARYFDALQSGALPFDVIRGTGEVRFAAALAAAAVNAAL
jgi:nicotinamide riboside kinase